MTRPSIGRVLLSTVVVVLAGGCGASPVSPSAQVTPPAGGLIGEVAAGGYVLFFRHAERDTTVMSSAQLAGVDNRGECVPGSELTANGVADALAIAQGLRRYGIHVQKVYASPTCRTSQMAGLAFGPFEATRALTWPSMWGEGEADTLTPALRALLSTPPAPHQDIVLVGHNDVLRADRVGVDVTLDQAEAAVFRPLGGDRFELVGKIPKADWLR